MDETKIKGITMGSVYAEDYGESYRFYNGILGLDEVSPMGDKACYFNIGKDQGMYLEGGFELLGADEKSAKASFTFKVESASKMFEKLKKKGVRMIQSEAMKMGENMYWFQCWDPSDNIVEFMGGA
jgi:predicted enzyme related to lactoylglutathione lyase